MSRSLLRDPGRLHCRLNCLSYHGLVPVMPPLHARFTVEVFAARRKHKSPSPLGPVGGEEILCGLGTGVTILLAMIIFKRRASKKKARECMSKALALLNSARENPDFCCDVCGPHGHYFFTCYSASMSAVEGLLVFRDRKFEWHTPLKQLVALAFDNVSDREHCMELATRFSEISEFDPREDTGPPSQVQRDEAFRLAEELVLRVMSVLPKEVRPQR